MDHFIFRQSADLELLVCKPMEAQGFINAFTTRYGGVSPLPAAALNLGNYSQDDYANITENRRRLKEALGLPDWPLLTLRQIHSADVHSIFTIDGAAPFLDRNPPPGDAIVSCLTRVLLAIQTADCLPILIADRRTGVTAAIHAGWRGTVAGIVTRTVGLMQQRLGVSPADLIVAQGPAIGPCCFEVGPEVIARFRELHDQVDCLLSGHQVDGRANLDLPLANRLQFRQLGVDDSSIYDCNLCTVCQNDKFFSYRLEKGAERPVGRLMGLIGRNQFDE
ncbi:MAG: peptidoglycan editing factor PgeF [Blastocatellia bacterium]